MPDPSALRVIDGKEQHAGENDDRGKNYESLGKGHLPLCSGITCGSYNQSVQRPMLPHNRRSRPDGWTRTDRFARSCLFSLPQWSGIALNAGIRCSSPPFSPNSTRRIGFVSYTPQANRRSCKQTEPAATVLCDESSTPRRAQMAAGRCARGACNIRSLQNKANLSQQNQRKGRLAHK
jgi:hypothetical protein